MALILIDLNLSQALKLILFVFSCPASVTYIFFLCLFLCHRLFPCFSPSFLNTLSLFLFTTFGETFLFFSCIKPRISRSSILRRCKSSIAIKLERRLFVGLSVAGSRRKKNEETIPKPWRWWGKNLIWKHARNLNFSRWDSWPDNDVTSKVMASRCGLQAKIERH